MDGEQLYTIFMILAKLKRGEVLGSTEIEDLIIGLGLQTIVNMEEL